VTGARQTFWRRHRWLKWVAGGMLGVLAIAATITSVALKRVEPFLRERIVEELEERFHARVELDSFHVSLVNGLWAEGRGLRIWPPAIHPKDEDLSLGTPANMASVAVPQGQGEPMIRLEEFRFRAPFLWRPGKPLHVSLVELKGLSVHLPPRSHFLHKPSDIARPEGAMSSMVRFEVEKMECTGAELVMETDKPGKLPLDFQIARFKLTDITADGKMGLDAELTVPKPQGAVQTKGSFGPWQGADPGESPLAGDYRFEHADLSVFKGIAGTLSSTGHYEGTLRDLVVDGMTETPDFQLTHFGATQPLATSFHARVDGTNGDTWLEPVDATLGNSHFTAQGQIVRVPGNVVNGVQQYAGHDIALTVYIDKAHIEDFLRLASRTGATLMTGNLTMKAALHIPPGSAAVDDRMKLKGSFNVDGARFTSEKIQGRIAELSLRGQGRPDDVKTTDPASILSQIHGNVQMAGGVISLPSLQYIVPGAQIQLNGTYKLADGALNFTGTAKMESPISKIVGGWKGTLLKPANHMFKHDGARAEIPIHIKGTREEPKFGIDFGKIMTEKKQ